MRQIAIGSDHGGFKLKEEIKRFLDELNIGYQDFGNYSEEPSDYPDIASKVAKAVSEGRYERGILICTTGIGMSIFANRVKGVRASLCHDVFSARLSRAHNDANILTMGQQVIGYGLAKEIVNTWLSTEFSGEERHLRRIGKIN